MAAGSGVVDDARWDAFDAQARRHRRRARAPATAPTSTRKSSGGRRARVLGQGLEREYALTDLLRRPGVTTRSCMTLPGTRRRRRRRRRLPSRSRCRSSTRATSTASTTRSTRQLAQETLPHPARPRLRSVRGLSTEVRQKLERQQAGDGRPGGAHLRHHAGGDIAAARPPEAWRNRPRKADA